MSSKDEIADLKARVPLTELIGLKLRNGKTLCPFHKERTPSFHVFPDRYHCFGCGAGGDHLDWLKQQKGLTTQQSIEHLRQLAGRSAPASNQTKRDPEETRKFALSIWNDARPIKGTLAEAYLNTRHIDVTSLPTAALRFHARCVFGRGNYQPCLIALFRNPVTDKPTGIHRIRVALNNQKVSFPTLNEINALTVLVDHDANSEGQKASTQCIWRWRRAGREAFGLIPQQVDTDFNDLVRRRAS